ncbi:MAG: hypothetical protein FWF96_06380 [Kiritimatiellaeota bacterium]|nr:hypothetical protein [Kiritimatiellota bacterium]
MKFILRIDKAWWPALAWALFGVVLFWPVAGLYNVLPAPDDASFFMPGHFWLDAGNARAAGRSFAPLNFLPALMPALAAHDFAYLLAPLLVMLAAAWWFTARGMDRLPALMAGGALGFAGYSFTLVAAGHRGFFDMTVYLMLLLGALPRALTRQRLIDFALAGAAAGWALTAQPDFAVVGLGVAAMYAIWILASGAWRGIKPVKFAGGAALALACLALSTAGTFQNIFTTLLPGREAQIAASETNTAKTSGEKTEDPRTQWIFATNWSLPPEESLELVAPNYKGTGDGGDPKRPYWGRLGRPLDWKKEKKDFPNYRQHAVYIGLAPLLIGLFAVFCLFLKNKPPSAKDSRDINPLHDVPFWAALGVVALLLAFGRHAPFYKLFYAIPKMDLLRAPVKFIRVVEWSTAFCFASGLTVLLRRLPSWKEAKIMWGVLAACAVVFLAFMGGAHGAWAAQVGVLRDFFRGTQFAPMFSDAAAPLRAADDAVLLDTTDLNLAESFEKLSELFAERFSI